MPGADPPPPRAPDHAGGQAAPPQVGPYQILSRLGGGGMGEVFLARDTRLGRQVAIKSLHPRMLGSDHFATLLLREARAAARLQHPNIAQVYDVVESDGQTHIVMEYLEGESLAERLRRTGPMPAREVVGLGLQMTAALEHAHAQGILHCDLKPANVFQTRDGQIKVLDFGLARVVDAATAAGDAGLGATPTLQAMHAGTPAYMSPEQKSGSRVTESSDIYSLGLVFHELCTGRRPSQAIVDDSGVTATAVAVTPEATISTPLLRVIATALAEAPEQRYRSATQLKAALEEAAGALGGPRAIAVRPWIAAAGVATVIAIAALAVWWPLGAGPVSSTAGLPIVAVLPFVTEDAATETRYLAAGLTELITDHLSVSEALVVVSNASVRAANTDPASLGAAARALGATFVIAGRLEPREGRMQVTLTGFDSRAGRITATQDFTASLADVVADSRAITATVRSLLSTAGVPAGGPPPDAQRAPVSRAALEDYAHGRDLLDRHAVGDNLDQAIVLLDRAVGRAPAFGLAHAALGEARWRMYRRTRDAEWARRAQASTFDAMRVAPDEARVRYTAAQVLRGTGEPGKAADELQRALTLQPNFAEAHALLGSILAESGKLDEAMASFTNARTLQPAAPDTYRRLGLACFDAGRYEDAIAAFTKEIEFRPDSAVAYQLIGASAQSLGRLDDALTHYTRANEIAPTASAYANIGMIRFGQRRFDEAVAAYRKAAEIEPRVPETHRNLGDSLARQGNPAAAADAWRQAIALAGDELRVNPKDARLRVLQAICHAKLRQPAAARTAAAAARDLAPTDGEVQYLAGVAYAILGETDESLRQIQRALALGFSRSIIEGDENLVEIRKAAGYPRVGSTSTGR